MTAIPRPSSPTAIRSASRLPAPPPTPAGTGAACPTIAGPGAGRPRRQRGWYLPGFGQIGSRPISSTIFVQNQYFVLGDNRSGACDSRVFGPISGSSIVGDAIAVVVRHGHVFLRKL